MEKLIVRQSHTKQFNDEKRATKQSSKHPAFKQEQPYNKKQECLLLNEQKWVVECAHKQQTLPKQINMMWLGKYFPVNCCKCLFVVGWEM